MKINIQVISKGLYFIFVLILLAACNGNQKDNIQFLQGKLKAKLKTIAFFWTTWCGASKSVLKSTYCNRNFNDSDLQVLSICVDCDVAKISKIVGKDTGNVQHIILPKPLSSLAMMTRKNLRSLLQATLQPTELLPQNTQFGVPLSYLIDSALVLRKNNLPQEYEQLVTTAYE
jgi:hypothetical protein